MPRAPAGLGDSDGAVAGRFLQAEVIGGGVLCWGWPCGSQLGFFGAQQICGFPSTTLPCSLCRWVTIFQIERKHHLL